jgi:predicted MFS family arabinose efflux permease
MYLCPSMKNFIKSYFEVYKDLSAPAWMLSIVMLVNRSGAMVVPFLGVYMVKHLSFSLQDAGILLSVFGLGSVIGSTIGGWLTDKFSAFKVQLFSLSAVVPVFLVLPLLTTVNSLGIGIFILSALGDIFRPANSVSLSHYSTPDTVVRSFTLNRMAMNLGFSIGPALGGFLAAISYDLLFYGNAFTALVAAVIFYFYFRNKKGFDNKKVDESDADLPYQSPYKDFPFLIFTVLSILFAICFFQLLSTLPLYYRQVYQLNEHSIGIILAYSGIVVFTLEMLIVHIAEQRTTAFIAIIWGVICCGLAFLLLISTSGIWLLYLSMFVLCISEILAMPFMATVTLKRSNKKNRGAYMGLNALSLSAGLIFAPLLGTKIADKFGFEVLWAGTGILAALTAVGFYILMKRMRLEK